MWKIIRYLAKPPEGLLPMEIFYPQYDSFYQIAQSRHRLDAYYIDGEAHYFLVSRPAPSLTEKRVATGGKMKFDGNDSLAEYEEIFRTWKMQPDSLRKKSILLFEKMVKGEPLEKYQTRFTAPEEFIEFPDEKTYYDKEARAWRSK
jgi:hypothetical protein